MPPRDRGPRRGPTTPAQPAGRRSGRRRVDATPTRAGRAPSARRPGTAGERLPDRVVVGTVPPAVRVSGVLLVLAGVSGAVAPFLPYLVVGGERLRLVTGVADAVLALLLPALAIAVGVSLVRGLLPKLGLAYAAVGGVLSVGRLCIELYQGQGSTTRPATEVLAGELVLTSTVEARPGWVLGVVALALTVLAGAVAAAAWGRTVMEDGGSLDPLRPVLAGTAALLGALTVLALTLPAVDVPDELLTDPTTGLETLVTVEGPQGLLERPGLALLGGLLLAGTLLLCSVMAPSLRPRLAVVGGLAAVAAVVLVTGLTGLRDAVSSPDVTWTVPGAALLVLGVLDAGLAVLAWRWRPRVPPGS